jgi:hypothetical protein
MVRGPRKPVEPFTYLTHGQNPQTPHRAHHMTVYYFRGGQEFFTVPGNACDAALKAGSEGRSLSCSIQRAQRMGLEWNAEDKRDQQVRVADRELANSAFYDRDRHGAVVRKVKKTATVVGGRG